MNGWELAFVVIASYLIGAIPIGYMVGRVARGIDVRDYGSGVMGATNVLRTLGRGPFIGVLIADALKGYVPTLITWTLSRELFDNSVEVSHELQVAAGIAAVIGHDFPVYIRFRGGRGVATSFGVYAALAMPLAVGLVAVGIFIVLTLRYMSVLSMITVPLGAVIMLAFALPEVAERANELFGFVVVPPADYTYTKSIFGAFATALVLLTHSGNIRRLISGTEPRIGEAGEPRTEIRPERKAT